MVSTGTPVVRPIDVVMSMMPAPGGIPATLQGTLSSSRTRRTDVSPPPAYTAADAAADIYVIKTMRSPCL